MILKEGGGKGGKSTGAEGEWKEERKGEVLVAMYYQLLWSCYAVAMHLCQNFLNASSNWWWSGVTIAVVCTRTEAPNYPTEPWSE